jgi:predicted ribosome quality control (RQC) complex YloA/Tae2 family protein
VHQNYYFLRPLSEGLAAKLESAVISECFSQTKEELIIRFETHTKPFFIRASLLSVFSTLSFPDEFQRARKNSVDLFTLLIGQRVQGTRQFKNERSFAILLTNNLQLVFKMHGNRSNILLFENEKVTELFKKNIKGDQAILLNTLDREIDWSFEQFKLFHQTPEKLYYTFGKLVWQYFESIGYHHKSLDDQWQLIKDVLAQLERKEFFISTSRHKPVLSLLDIDPNAKKYSEAITAANEFFYAFTQVYVFEKEKADALSKLRAVLASSFSYLEKTSAKLKEIEGDTNYKVWGDLIMANLHAINTGVEKITLDNLYDNQRPLEIKLKKDLSPQKNAEIFYRKAKNQQIEINHLKKALTDKKSKIEEIKASIFKIEEISNLKSLRALIGKKELFQNDNRDAESLPYHEFEFKGYRILVGKNAQSNDILTQQLSYKEDLWLHAKDVAGSHVLIKHQAGKKFPKDVIERAAQLAAYNSKRKNDTLCPVIVTPKKFVRKRKGDLPGAVVVEREDVIMVEPRL